MLDFYRGALSPRLLGVLVRQLPIESALVRALNGGETPWNRIEHLTADVWALWAKQDNPRRVAAETQARIAVKQAKVIRMNERRKQEVT